MPYIQRNTQLSSAAKHCSMRRNTLCKSGFVCATD